MKVRSTLSKNRLLSGDVNLANSTEQEFLENSKREAIWEVSVLYIAF
ncbi:hypothetical protein F3D3_2339 [Fusibacter sp. 3D3]|nr:hypothetical protein F3D3_2339 [Fusibacter sp. 3D3]